MRKPWYGEDRPGSFENWLNLQEELQEGLELSLRARLGDESELLRSYRREYLEDLPRWTGQVLRPRDLLERLSRANLVLLGDYHSLVQSQRSALRLLRRMVQQGLRPSLGLEMFPISLQSELDAFLSHKLDEEELLHLFREHWDFLWSPVRALLLYARYHRLHILALNSDPSSASSPLLERDHNAARVISKHRPGRQEGPLLVLFGDFHLASNHLPAALRESGYRGKILRIFQNPEGHYWQSLRQLGESPEILELENGDLSLQSATPIVKLQSYHYWLTLRELDLDTVHLTPPSESGELLPDLSQEVDHLLHMIAKLLRIPVLEESQAAIFWMGEENFAKEVSEQGHWTEAETRKVASGLAFGIGTYLLEKNVGILAELSQNRMAEMASRILHARCSRIHSRPRGLSDDFYLRVIENALIFLGSKILNPLRKYRDLASLRKLLRESDREERDWRKRAEQCLDYLEAEERYLKDGDVEHFPGRLYRLDAAGHLALTRSVGKHLGGRLYEALMDGKIDRMSIRELFFENFPLEGSPTRSYLGLLDLLGAAEGNEFFAGNIETL
ncbi:MAG: ChaN family lipoprotein [Candidatus Krumholzibacteria bacterium]|nr:ChaN family lipoprotein [Candidatus Krumholzibacteria bacterium]MDP6669272.1 ChaN family lipoprotein [Candidatus Krumholzibacteria bacterium]MDP6796550.1 ChaN family lipoprotein [Candidatus Krumholzibacteria bacterium]